MNLGPRRKQSCATLRLIKKNVASRTWNVAYIPPEQGVGKTQRD